MIDVHKHLIKKATEVPPISFTIAKYTHRNRLLSLVKNDKRLAEIARVETPKLPQDLFPGPAIHKCINKGQKHVDPEPFQDTAISRNPSPTDAEAEQILKRAPPLFDKYQCERTTDFGDVL